MTPALGTVGGQRHPLPTTPHPARWNLELKLPLPMQPPCQLAIRTGGVEEG